MIILRKGDLIVKLQINESDSVILYIDMVSFSQDYKVNEDIDSDFVFTDGGFYDSDISVRWDILLEYIIPIADEIENFPFVSDTNPYSSSPNNTDGLSNYIGIEFNHPDFIPEDKLDELYRFKLRFSDHENKHPENGKTEEINMIGMKPKNLRKSAMKIFKSKLSDIQANIKKYEIDTYGEQYTFFDGRD